MPPHSSHIRTNGGGGVVVAKHGSNSNVDRAAGVGVPDRVATRFVSARFLEFADVP
jgi:hypothetical protein